MSVPAVIVAGKKAMSVTYCILGIQQRICHIFICGLSGSTIFFHIIP